MFPTTSLLIALLPLLTAANPLAYPAPDNPFFTYKPLTLTFHGGPATYDLALRADGNTYSVSNPLAVSEITVTPADFDIYYNCNFYFKDDGGKQVAVTRDADGNGVHVGPPRAVTGVSCQPTGDQGICLPVYATCQWCGGMNGQGGCRLLNCCSGYCAATKCRKTS
ncbi:uncharacterized protein L3040_005197 [Drepanopeziza brunnea f. sp. 'multigermtubi']|uniref:uncharacterized protein n=1 Tax=Drepanopeziza brunnea f. sp. 'multigermtubi' TaxID=698441 RepID=UPI00239637C7|nr:hypothetical protein L3040_005197 [Drepanopeziza brunnea f. sp. 'multigermtubi']